MGAFIKQCGTVQSECKDQLEDDDLDESPKQKSKNALVSAGMNCKNLCS